MRRIKLLTILLAVAGCASISPNLPPITEEPTGNRHAGRIVWHDLLTNTPEASRTFYSELFGWEFEAPGIDLGFGTERSYMIIRHDGRIIGGMVDTNALGRKENISQWVTTMSVVDVDRAVSGVVDAGGKVLTAPVVLQDRGTLAVIEDPTGALFALIQTKNGDPDEHEPVLNGWLWNELWTSDVAAATSFYRDFAEFEVEDHSMDDAGRRYRVLKSDGKPRAAILDNPFEGQRPVWVNYIRVDDPSAITARVEGLGGRILVEARERPIGGEVAFVAGPSGAGVAVQTWPLE